MHRLPYEGQEKLFSILDKVNTAHLVQVGQHIQFRCALFRHYRVGQLGTIAYLPAAYPGCIDLPGIRQRSVEEQLELIEASFSVKVVKLNVP